jgi:hypothetical protein
MAIPAGELPPPQHQTLAVEDWHTIGREGVPVLHYTRQKIRALPDLDGPMRIFPYRFDTNAVEVTVPVGGVAGELYEVQPGFMHAVDIELDEPLAPGQETELEYGTRFNYRKPPPPLFRRGIGKSVVESLDIHVTFDRDSVPNMIWRTIWNGYVPDASVDTEAPARLVEDVLDDGLTASLHRRNIRDKVIGLRWQWGGGTHYTF